MQTSIHDIGKRLKSYWTAIKDAQHSPLNPAGLRTALAHRFGFDLRALAIFRMALGLLVIFDAVTRLGDAEAFYSNFGVMPIANYLQEVANRMHISLHFASGLLAWQYLLLTLQILSGLALLLGLRTRHAVIIAWILTVSLHNRNVLILNGGDVLLRLLLFWSMFLPLGSQWSIDDLLTRLTANSDAMSQKNLILSGGSIALTLQLVYVYLGTALLKTGPDWWPNGTASYYALALDSFVTPFGLWLRQWTALLQYATYAVYFLELLAPLFWFSPICLVPLRCFSIVALIFLHLNFELTMRLGMFPWIDIAALLVLLPSQVLDRLEQHCKNLGQRYKIFQDTQRWQKLRKFIQSAFYSGLTPPGIDSSQNPQARATKLRAWLANSLAIFFIGYIGIINLDNLPKVRIVFLPPWDKIGSVLRLDQNWNMFAPFPIREDGWYIVDGRLKDGTSVDVLQHQLAALNAGHSRINSVDAIGVSYDKPANIAYDAYPNARWRKFLLSLSSAKKKNLRSAYAKYLCRLWNRGDLPEGRKLNNFDIYFMEEYTQPPGQEPELRKRHLWRHNCFG